MVMSLQVTWVEFRTNHGYLRASWEELNDLGSSASLSPAVKNAWSLCCRITDDSFLILSNVHSVLMPDMAIINK